MKQNNQIKIAVTGGIGSGKSTVCSILRKRGYAVYSCDEVYKLVLRDDCVIKQLAAEFGDGIVNDDGTLNRVKLSAIVFDDEEKLKRLNKITHPKIFDKMFYLSKEDEGVVFFEVPLLFEGGYQVLFDDVLVILRDDNKRIEGVVQRDGLTENEVKNRLNKQTNYNIADLSKYYVIHNNDNIVNLNNKIEDFLVAIALKKYS